MGTSWIAFTPLMADLPKHRLCIGEMHDHMGPQAFAEGWMSGPVYALNLFNVTNRDEYLAYSRRSVKEVQAHGGRVVALGRFRKSAVGHIEPRSVLIVVEWNSMEAFDSYVNDPRLADLHPHRVNGTSDYVWHVFDKLEDLRPVLK